VIADLAIAGAGLGGLALARAAQLRGLSVRVVERAPALGEIGAGLTLSPNAVKVYQALGLEEALLAVATRPQTQGVVHWQDARVLVENERGDRPRERYGADYLHILRSDAHRLLAEAVTAADPGAVTLGVEVAGAGSEEAGAWLELADGSRLAGAVVVGADGVKSAVRASLFGADAPEFTGHVAWRGVVPVDAVRGPLPALASGLAIAPGKTFGFYALRGGTLINYVALSRRDVWAEEGWTVQADKAELLTEFSGWAPELIALIAATLPEDCYRWGLFARPPMPRWSKGRVGLLGDAAHPMLPFMGQGAAMALEDGVVLARCLAAFSPLEALARYEAARRARATFVQAESRAKGNRVEGADPSRYTPNRHRNEESLGLFVYDAAKVML
jgi:salicylate hydroxylase